MERLTELPDRPLEVTDSVMEIAFLDQIEAQGVPTPIIWLLSYRPKFGELIDPSKMPLVARLDVLDRQGIMVPGSSNGRVENLMINYDPVGLRTPAENTPQVQILAHARALVGRSAGWAAHLLDPRPLFERLLPQ